MNISKITIGRLFNLGNYEHVRYEVTVDVAAGESAANALTGLENILAALNPRRPHGVPSEADLRNLESSLAATREATDEQIRRSYGLGKYVRIVSLQNSIRDGKAALTKWEARRAMARLWLDKVGGAAEFKDAKHDWDDDQGGWS